VPDKDWQENEEHGDRFFTIFLPPIFLPIKETGRKMIGRNMKSMAITSSRSSCHPYSCPLKRLAGK
jgi:hypothetical protein